MECHDINMSSPKPQVRWIVEDLGLSNSKGVADHVMKAYWGIEV